jgi:hypothetical protein
MPPIDSLEHFTTAHIWQQVLPWPFSVTHALLTAAPFAFPAQGHAEFAGKDKL